MSDERKIDLDQMILEYIQTRIAQEDPTSITAVEVAQYLLNKGITPPSAVTLRQRVSRLASEGHFLAKRAGPRGTIIGSITDPEVFRVPGCSTGTAKTRQRRGAPRQTHHEEVLGAYYCEACGHHNTIRRLTDPPRCPHCNEILPANPNHFCMFCGRPLTQ